MLKQYIIKTIKFYQIFISPLIGKHCRFYPSCSEYGCLAIQKFGTIKGCWKTLKRVIRCHPWNKGGIDMP
ncbi:MAG: membrane protein insertion efficiency factor YidD [Patescibacteria group bacterium]|nr:membrane protein insertion efficiency factor YidD [Patescibacteria group bacterium]